MGSMHGNAWQPKLLLLYLAKYLYKFLYRFLFVKSFLVESGHYVMKVVKKDGKKTFDKLTQLQVLPVLNNQNKNGFQLLQISDYHFWHVDF